MPTKQEILEKYRLIHDDITKQYCVDKTLDKATFDTQHTKCWNDLQQDLFANGFAKKVWNYTFGATITTEVGDFNLTVTIESSFQLTPTQIQNSIDKVKTADWQLVREIEYVVEV